jgi:cytidylate kinase
VCDYLEVLPEQIEIFFGKNIVLHDASLPNGQKEDIKIPIDKKGRMVINFAGPWSDSYTHYSFESILEAARDDETINILKEEIADDIAILSDISIGGRDIGTVVFSDAEYKFYLDASVEERALRRLHDEKNHGKKDNLLSMIDKIKERDEYDSTREISPLKMAPDALYIDSTHMTVDEVCDLIINKVQE